MNDRNTPGEADPLGAHGVIPPTVTAFHENEDLDLETTAALARFVVDAGSQGVFPLGTNGEFALLSSDERARVVEAVADEVGDDVPVFAGVGAPSTRETVRNATRAERLGADGLIVVTPYYYDLESDGLREHYRAVAAATESPIYLYHIPRRTGIELSLETLSELLEIDSVVGCKDSSGDLVWLGQAIDRNPSRTFVGGSDALVFSSLQLGCSGVVSAIANVFPSLVVDLYDASVDGDRESALTRQRVLYELRAAIEQGPTLAGVKAALDLRGFDPGPIRRPLCGFDQSEMNALEETITDLEESGRLER
ncbi:dihydrodipicolinate synthase family protein [Halostagnicola kamekurae]|uniref:2-keto-3-deoxy-phosphogluconate aldolase n=1 Tax=Halostagnicola kamekurae TaxID=619731 RepID=A0A1I6UHZ8_9EURY|nr:dihydrodipicolinate synthase family protein [Halostagnicola kamekurae]SFT01053.1 2-keto-3-deoxy-phosphogluconate aldolase [Halostagnicola kamekurae]